MLFHYGSSIKLIEILCILLWSKYCFQTEYVLHSQDISVESATSSAQQLRTAHGDLTGQQAPF